MEELGKVIDIGAGVVDFNSLGVSDLPLICTAKGQLAVNLLEFNLDALDDFAFTHDSSDEAAVVHEEAEDKAETGEERAEREFCQDAMRSYNEHLAPGGWNPDGWHNHLARLEMMKDEVDAWEEHQRTGQAADSFPDTDVSEDVSYFQDTVAHDRALVRRVTNRKGKKLVSMTYALEGGGWQFRGSSRMRQDPQKAAPRQDMGEEAALRGANGTDCPLCHVGDARWGTIGWFIIFVGRRNFGRTAMATLRHEGCRGPLRDGQNSTLRPVGKLE